MSIDTKVERKKDGWCLIGMWVMSIAIGWVPILGWFIVLATIIATVAYFFDGVVGE